MTLKRGYMQQVIENILKEYSENEANLSSEVLREHLTKDIIRGIKLWVKGEVNG